MVRNLQGARPVNTRFFRRLVETLLRERVPNEDFDLGVCIISARAMTRLNETFLRHGGSTDVITFDYGDRPGQVGHGTARRKSTAHPADWPDFRSVLEGGIFICADEAVSQARRFRTCWEAELVRYLVHGILHLQGYDDSRAGARRRMKKEEDRLVRRMSRLCDFAELNCRSRAKKRQAILARVAGRGKVR